MLCSRYFLHSLRGPFLNKYSYYFQNLNFLSYFTKMSMGSRSRKKYFSVPCSSIFNNVFICHSSEEKPVQFFINILCSPFKFLYKEYTSHNYRSLISYQANNVDISIVPPNLFILMTFFLPFPNSESTISVCTQAFIHHELINSLLPDPGIDTASKTVVCLAVKGPEYMQVGG